jgi:hypothetical protein
MRITFFIHDMTCHETDPFAAPQPHRRCSLSGTLLHHLDGEPGQLVGREVLGRPGGLPDDELEVIARCDVHHAGSDVPHAAVALVALLCCAEERVAVLVDPDIAMAATESSSWSRSKYPSRKSRGKTVVGQTSVATRISVIVVESPQDSVAGTGRTATPVEQEPMGVAMVVEPDIKADNGVIHGIDVVLLPPEVLRLF